MLDIFLGLRHFVKRRAYNIDNTVFRLHWLVTTIMLICVSIALTARQFIGQTILCFSTRSLTMPNDLVNAFCLIQSTFTWPPRLDDKPEVLKNYDQLDMQGLRNSIYAPPTELVHHTYYQWVSFSLFAQAIIFYLPYYLWKLWEGGLMRSIAHGMRVPLVSVEDRSHKQDILLDYFSRHYGTHMQYACKYFMAEALCLVNVIAQFIYINWFLDGDFLWYGPLVMSYVARKIHVDPVARRFPLLSKCIISKTGYSGDVEKADVLCHLPLNIFNGKLFFVLWWWLLILFVLTLFVFAYRLPILFSQSLRAKLLKGRCPLCPMRTLKALMSRGNFGDWFVLYMLSKNVDAVMMSELCEELRKRFDARDMRRTPKGINMETTSCVE